MITLRRRQRAAQAARALSITERFGVLFFERLICRDWPNMPSVVFPAHARVHKERPGPRLAAKSLDEPSW